MGNAEVGKSCIIKRYCEKRFVNKYLTTIGIDYGVTKVSLKDRDIKVNIFDMAGHPLFYEETVAMVTSIIFSLAAFFLMVDNFVLDRSLPHYYVHSAEYVVWYQVSTDAAQTDIIVQQPVVYTVHPSVQASVFFTVLHHSSTVDQTVILRPSSLTKVKPHSVFSQTVDIGTKPTFVFNGNGSYGISVYMTDGMYSETLTALPVSGWGRKYIAVTLRYVDYWAGMSGWGRKYIAVTLRKNPSILIVNAVKDNQIVVRFKESAPAAFRALYRFNETFLRIHLAEYESYSLSRCNGLVGSLTGTVRCIHYTFINVGL
ncbi:hypothetical protein Btru_058769 [Bulinus truncatus]|nr:hypothetical protein Btru_058769 [Bulinus truncatus]